MFRAALPYSSDQAAVFADGTPLLAANSPARHPLRRRTDSRDVIDVEAQVVPLSRMQAAVAAYGRVSELGQPTYRAGLLFDERA